DIIGGVPIWFPTPVKDTYSGLLVEEPGCTVLDQNGALSYARSRHFHYKDERGRWRSDGSSDYGRMRRQQDLLRRVMHRAISKGARNPVVLSRMVETGVEHIELDPYTTAADLITLGRAFQRFDPDKLGQSSLTVREVYRGGADVLELDERASEPVLAQFRGTGGSGDREILPSTVTVRVLNGTGVQDQASELTDRFEELGFQVASPNSADPVWVTEVRYPPGSDAEAHLVARYLDAEPQLIPDPDVTEITVVTGPELVGVLDTPRPPEAVPTTTSTSTTTTTSTSTTTTTAPDDEAAADDESDDEADEPEVSIPLVEGIGPAGEGRAYLPGEPPPGESCG
ncbi:MAG TPA: LCP family protein, partial [Acidimicrobiales bacterium]|nr:LCP family protein [Acidimicrobiales bacterium]